MTFQVLLAQTSQYVELEAGVEAERVWMTCDCGAVIWHRLDPLGPDR